VRVSGNVNSGFEVRATGNVEVGGVVEGAYIEAGGDIIISSGMKGMGKGTLKAGNNITCKFLENCNAFAEGFVNTESILHSNVSAGTVVNVTSSKGFITGGRVQAEELVEVRTLGAVMGANTIVEVGVNPEIKARFLQCQKDVAEIIRQIKQAQPVIQSFTEKKSRGANFSAEQLKYVKETAQLLETKKQELEQKSAEMNTLSEAIDPNRPAMVKVTGEVYPGTTIVIGDVSMNVQSSYRYCRFQKQDGDVKMMPL